MAELATTKTYIRLLLRCLTLSLICVTEASSLQRAPGAREQVSHQMPDEETWSASGKVRKVLASKDNPLESVLFPRMWDAIADAGRNSGKYNVSEMCSAGLSIYTKSLEKMEPWAIRMYDATGKENSGLLMGDLTQQGNYDECLNLRQYQSLELTLAARDHGTQFCSAYFSIPDWMTDFVKSLNIPYPVRLPRPTVDLCVPHTCSQTDIYHIISQYIQNATHKVDLVEVSCFQKPDVRENPGALAAIGVLSALLLLNVIGTCLDIKQRLKMADILSGNVTEIGEMGRRFSRFSASIFLHRRSTDDGEKNKENAGGRPSLLRQLSDSLMRRRSSLSAVYHQRRKLSDGWKPLDRDSVVIHNGGTQTLRTFSIGTDENSQTDQEKSNGTVYCITESESKSWDTNKITADGLQSPDTQADNNNIPRSPSRTDVGNGVSQCGLPIEVRTEFVEVNGQLDAAVVNDIHNEDNSGRPGPSSTQRDAQSLRRSSEVSMGQTSLYARQSSTVSSTSVNMDGCSEPQVTSPSPTRQTAPQNPSTNNWVNPASRDCDVALQATTDKNNKQLPDAVVMKIEAKSGMEMDNSEHNSAVQQNHVYDNASFCDTEAGDVSDIKISTRSLLNGSSAAGDVQTATSPTSDQTVSFDQVYNLSPRRSSVDIGLHSKSAQNPLSSIPEEGSEESGRAAQSKKPIVTIDNLSIAEVGVVCGDQRCGKQARKTTSDSSIKSDGVASRWIARRSLAVEVLLCFSFLRNLRRLLGEGNADMLFTLNGVRVMSIFWIVLGNTISLLNKTASVVANNVDTVKIAQSFWMQAIINSTFAADSFFVLSGCLVTYHFLHSKTHKMQKTNGKGVFSFRGLVLFYFHRLMRLLPCFYVAIVLYTVLLPYMGQGPRWKGTDKGLQQCQDHWWANAFFFSNFYKADDMCMPWTYYLVNDFQFYLLSPLVLYPLLLKPLLGGFLIVLLVVIQIVSTCLLMNNINGNMLNMEEGYFDEVYVKPYCRVGAFAVGMALGYFLHSTEHRVYFRKLPLFLGWTLSLCTIGTVVYVTHTENQPDGQKWTRLQSAVYEALSRPAWAMSVSWIIFTSTVGQGGFINNFLSWSPFVAMCRLTYGVYLLHPVLITVVLNSSRFPIYLHFGSLIYMYVANLVCSYGIGFLLIALVECPFTKLDILMRVKLKKKST